MPERHFEIITENSGVDARIFTTIAGDAKEAFMKYIKTFEGLSDLRIKALQALGLEDAVNLANEWLTYEIARINVVTDVLYVNEKTFPITTI